MPEPRQITGATVRADFNDPVAVAHYARAAHFLGLWKSEQVLIERFFPDRTVRLLEAGCGAGRATVGLWDLGYRHITAFDFAADLLDQARHLAADRGIPVLAPDTARGDVCGDARGDACEGIAIIEADATALETCHPLSDMFAGRSPGFDGALFLFNGLMQIPGRERRRLALRGLRDVCRPGAPLLFTTHDREHSAAERVMWRLEAGRWRRGEQDPGLVEFGDRYFEDEAGRTFMHLPDRREILEDLADTGWRHDFDALRRDVARESRAVIDFSDECRFWAATRVPASGGSHSG